MVLAVLLIQISVIYKPIILEVIISIVVGMIINKGDDVMNNKFEGKKVAFGYMGESNQ